jgi:phosphoglycolate phosphatase-like HAD superfamily hydrolase
MENLNFQGKTDQLILRESLLNEGFTLEEIEQKIDAFKERYFSILGNLIQREKVFLLPGVKEVIERLKEKNDIILGLLTGNFRESAEIKLDSHSLFGNFRFGVYGSDTWDRNMMPAIARHRLMDSFSLDIDYSRMVIIGDTIHDIACSKNSGSVSVSVGTGWTEKAVLLKEEPDYYFDNMNNIENVVDTIMNC